MHEGIAHHPALVLRRAQKPVDYLYARILIRPRAEVDVLVRHRNESPSACVRVGNRYLLGAEHGGKSATAEQARERDDEGLQLHVGNQPSLEDAEEDSQSQDNGDR